jgi:RHH-type proline utilization regulon transcriptional repressor/proline dehydrogenase/delta 1-pyrroline-5-carboxylate dehydrogenase
VVGPGKLDRACRIYAPVGSHETLLAYLVRRLLENGANTSFVNRIVDPAVDIGELVADPVAQTREAGGAPHPRIALPSALYRDRKNSRGCDFTDEAALFALERELEHAPASFDAAPLLGAPSPTTQRARTTLVNPAIATSSAASTKPIAPMSRAPSRSRRAPARYGAHASCRAPSARAPPIPRARGAPIALAVREAGDLPNAMGDSRGGGLRRYWRSAGVRGTAARRRPADRLHHAVDFPPSSSAKSARRLRWQPGAARRRADPLHRRGRGGPLAPRRRPPA